MLKGERFGSDNTTVTKTLEKGVYLYLCNLHSLVTFDKGMYIVSIAANPTYNMVYNFIGDPDTTVTVSTSENLLTVTSTRVFRGLLVKLTDSTMV